MAEGLLGPYSLHLYHPRFQIAVGRIATGVYPNFKPISSWQLTSK